MITKTRIRNKIRGLLLAALIPLATGPQVKAQDSSSSRQYGLAKTLIERVAGSFADLASQRSNTIRKEIEKKEGNTYQEKKNAYAKACAYEDILILNAAYRNQESEAEIDKLVSTISDRLAQDDKVCNYKDRNFRSALQKRVFFMIDTYNSLLDAPAPANEGEQGLRELLATVYKDSDTLDQYLAKHKEVTSQYYDATINALPFYACLPGKAILNEIKNIDISIYQNSIRNFHTANEKSQLLAKK